MATRVELLERMTREDHYTVDAEDAEDDGYVHFELCTPVRRWPCRVCEVETPTALVTLARRWQVAHACWDMWCIVDSKREAQWIIDDGCCDLPYDVTPLWMVRDEITKLPDWEPQP